MTRCLLTTGKIASILGTVHDDAFVRKDPIKHCGTLKMASMECRDSLHALVGKVVSRDAIYDRRYFFCRYHVLTEFKDVFQSFSSSTSGGGSTYFGDEWLNDLCPLFGNFQLPQVDRLLAKYTVLYSSRLFISNNIYKKLS